MKKIELRKKIAIIAGMGIMACSLAACGGSKSDTTAATTKESTKEEAKKDKEEKKEEKTTEAKKKETTEAKKEETTEAKKEETTEAKKEEKTTEAKKEETTAEANVEKKEDSSNDESGQNPVMNFIGQYVNERASITVSPKGEDEAEFFVTWSSSASTHSEWTMSGKYDTENNIVVYTNCTKKTFELNEDGSVANEVTDYENGMGTFEFMYPDGETVLKWDDAEESVASEMVFEYNKPAAE